MFVTLTLKVRLSLVVIFSHVILAAIVVAMLSVIVKEQLRSSLPLANDEGVIWGVDVTGADVSTVTILVSVKFSFPAESLTEEDFFSYCTYPQTIIVSHYTFLSENWEVRFCHHEMIPPDDWSMILIRQRGEIDAEVSYKEDSSINHSVYEIPVSEYPILYGY